MHDDEHNRVMTLFGAWNRPHAPMGPRLLRTCIAALGWVLLFELIAALAIGLFALAPLPPRLGGWWLAGLIVWMTLPRVGTVKDEGGDDGTG